MGHRYVTRRPTPGLTRPLDPTRAKSLLIAGRVQALVMQHLNRSVDMADRCQGGYGFPVLASGRCPRVNHIHPKVMAGRGAGLL